MSFITKTLLIVGVSAALAGAAYADGGEPWVLKADMGYTVDTGGKTTIVTLASMDKAMMAKATPVPKGMVFFMKDGVMMMMDTNTR